jgi:Spy/CpxP family protein refolding chaperone
MKSWITTQTCLKKAIAVLALGACTSVVAQGPGGPPPGGGQNGPGFPGEGPGMGGGPPQHGPGGGNRPGFELGPPGRWWDDRRFVVELRLRPEQQTRMDAVFEQNRATLLARLDGVRQAEAQMHALSRSPAPDEAALFAQIDRVSQARADLEKANTHLLLLIRREMDEGQIRQLEQQTPR